MIPTDIPTAISPAEVARLRELARGASVLELGCDYGFSALAMAEVAAVVHTVDWFRGDGSAGWRDSFGQARENIQRSGLADKIVMHIGSFAEVLSHFKLSGFDLVFADGSHNEPEVWDDLRLAFTMVRSDGRLAVHDYGGPFFSVKMALDALVAEKDLAVEEVIGTLAVVKVS